MTPIVIAFTPNYFIPAVTCLNSLLNSSSSIEHFEVFCLLSEPLPQSQKSLLGKLSKGGRLHFRYLDLDGRLSHINVSERFSVASLYRMILPELIPDKNKVIYHDCDIIIRQDLAKLYQDFDIGDNYLGVVYEATLPSQYEMVRNVGCEPGKYFNSGFLLMNLEAMRRDNISELLIKEAQHTNSEFLDQDVLNKICRNKCKALHPKYNFNRTMILPQYKEIFLRYYSEQDWIEGVVSGNIHYTGGKPWNEYSVMFSLWWDNFMSLSQEFRSDFYTDKKLYFLYRLEKNKFTRNIIEMAKSIKRYWK